MISWRNVSLLVAVAGLLVLFYLRINLRNEENIVSRIQGRLDDQVKAQTDDLDDFVNQLEIYSNPFDITSDRRFLKQVFIEGRLIYWSSSEYFPGNKLSDSQEGTFFYRGEYGIYLIAKRVVSQNSGIEVISMYPIYTSPPILNEYLRKQLNPKLFPGTKVEFNPNSAYSLVLDNGDTLSVTIVDQQLPVIDSLILLVVLMLAFTLFREVRYRKYGLLISVGLVGLTRLVLYLISTYVIDIRLFDPVVYTSALVPTMGDLILNSLTVLALLLLVRERLLKLHVSLFVELVFYSALNLVVLLYYMATWDMLENSLISLDVNQSIAFSRDRIWAMLYVLVNTSILAIAIHLVFLRVARLEIRTLIKLILTLSISAIFCILIPGDVRAVFPLLWAFVWVCHLFRLGGNPTLVSYRSLVFGVVILSFVSILHSYVIYRHHEKDQLVQIQKFGNWVLIKNDVVGEVFLRQTIDRIKSDDYIRSRFFNSTLSKAGIKDKIRREFLPAYFDKYELTTYFFDREGVPEGRYDSLWQFEERFLTTDNQTGYNDLFFIEGVSRSAGYMCIIPIRSFDILLGTVLLELNQKKYVVKDILPSLLIENRNTLTRESEFDYGIFSGGQLLHKQGEYEFENKISYEDLISPKLTEAGFEKDGYFIWGQRTFDNKVIVIVDRTYPSLGLVTNFSFHFFLIFSILSIMLILYRYLSGKSRTSLSYKIQLYLGFSFVVPILFFSLALLNTINESNKDEIDSSYQRKARGISDNLTDKTEQYLNVEINRDVWANGISEISGLVQADVNVYDNDGFLIGTTEEEIFSSNLVSRQIDPRALNAIKFGGRETIILKQYVGELGFKSSFNGIYSSKTGDLLGIFSLPYFDSVDIVQTQQRRVFSNLISIFTIILLMSVLTGNFIIRKLTSPLKQITSSLRITDFQGNNPPIEYESNDEIGSLVSEYNGMIAKLEASRQQLAEAQKASAWQEIARQVAHEIKNPLTPMRLKIQQLVRLKPADDPDLLVLNSLITQIDTLSSIADSFSEFAKMPAPKNEQVDLARAVRESVGLHQNESVDLSCSIEDEEFNVFIDPSIFSQIMNNLVLNAIQSSPQAVIHVNLIKKGNQALISVIDNGSGIPENLRDEVFKPYFSTKRTGSGIGLAVAKKGIENAGGNIWFETEEGQGTTFYLSLPLVV